MRVHANAKLTPKGRLLLVQRIEDGWGAEAAAASAGRQRAYRVPVVAPISGERSRRSGRPKLEASPVSGVHE